MTFATTALRLTVALSLAAMTHVAHAQTLGGTETVAVTITQNHMGTDLVGVTITQNHFGDDDVSVTVNNDHHGVGDETFGEAFGGVFGD